MTRGKDQNERAAFAGIATLTELVTFAGFATLPNEPPGDTLLSASEKLCR